MNSIHSYDGPSPPSPNIGGKGKNLNVLAGMRGVRVPTFTNIPSDAEGPEAAEMVGQFLFLHPDITSVAVRSSAEAEDHDKASFAGAYETMLNVPAKVSDIMEAIEKIRHHADGKTDVLNHYASQRSVEMNGNVGIVVQEMVSDPEFSGVMFSHDPQSEDGYMRIHFHEGLGEDLVSGNANGRDLKILRNSKPAKDTLGKYPFLSQALEMLGTVEAGMNSDSLDVEFAYKNEKFYTLQARSLTSAKEEAGSHELLCRYVSAVQNAINKILESGDRLGDMIDVNPRELLGEFPHPINVSVFKRMFADDVVEGVRQEMGYHPRNDGLMRVVAGKPYVSLLSSAHSFRPEGVSDETYKKLTDHYVRSLDARPQLQDRVEFELFYMNASEENQQRLASADYLTAEEKEEMLNALKGIDKNIDQVAAREMDKPLADDEAKEYESLAEIMTDLRVMTRTFVLNARLAFYHKNLADNVFGKENCEQLLKGIHTPSTDLQNDLYAYASGECDIEKLADTYGHLRPGQLDIFSPTYRSNIVHFLGLSHIDKAQLEKQMQNMEAHQEEGQRNVSELTSNEEEKTLAARLRFFMERRERVKFNFMRLYDVMARKMIEEAQQRNIPAEQLQQASFDELLALCDDETPNMPNEGDLRLRLQRRASGTSVRRLIQLPSVLVPDTADLALIEHLAQDATYVTNLSVSSDIAHVSKEASLDMEALREKVKGKIVVIDAADPGYDFLFTMEPSGLITCVGGPASHMTIRSIELEIPAAIGIGKAKFDVLCASNRATLDCGRKQIITLS
jgi:phosphohistidine swiveling domain-containing protein